LLFVILSVFVIFTDAHMWLRTPISRGGVNNIGGTSGPCSGLKAGTGAVTKYEVGQKVKFQFRVNQHGPGPFAFTLATSADNFAGGTVLKSNIANQVTAGPDSFQGVNVDITIPNTPCTGCSIQLSGMGQNDGSGKWYNCADIQIVPAGQLGVAFPASVSPTSGPTSGGTVVTVTGTGFGSATSTNIKCKFDLVVVTATWQSATSVRCTSPKKNTASSATLEVSLNGGTSWSTSGVQFSYTGSDILPTITSIQPTSGNPGTLVTVTGTNFFSSAMLCKFGTSNSDANVISETSATCMIPTAFVLQATVNFEVSVDGSPASTSGKSFVVTMDNGSSGSHLTANLFFITLGLLLVASFMFF